MDGWVPAASALRRPIDQRDLLPKIASLLKIDKDKVNLDAEVSSTLPAASKSESEAGVVSLPRIPKPSAQDILSPSHKKKNEKKDFVQKIREQKNLLAPERSREQKSPREPRRHPPKAGQGGPWNHKGAETLEQLEQMTKAARSMDTATKDRFHGMWSPYPSWYRALVEKSIRLNVPIPGHPYQKVKRVQDEFSSDLRQMYDEWDDVLRKGQSHASRSYTVSEDFLQAGDDEERRRSFDAARDYLEKNLFITHRFSRQLLDLWTSKYSQLSFFRKLDNSMFPTDLELFQQLQQAQCQYAKEFLLQKWVSDSRKVFAATPEHEWVAVEYLDKFIASIRCLMGIQLVGLLSQYATSVLELFDGFAPSSGREPLFILNLGLNERSKVFYSPKPEDAILQVKDLLELVVEAISSIPVIPSDLCSLPDYNTLIIVLPQHAELVVEECQERLVSIVEDPVLEPEEILERYQAYEYVLSEPYFKFPSNWRQGENWKNLETEWKRLWDKGLRLEGKIEKLSAAEENLGMFLVVTSGPEDQGLIREVLTSKARSLGKFMLNTIENHLFTQGPALLGEYEKIFKLCNGRPTVPKDLLLQIDGLKGMDKQLKQLRTDALIIKELHELLWDFNHAIDDDRAKELYHLFHMSSTATDTLREANEYLKSTKWIVEEELRKQRNDLQGALFDLTKSKLKTIEGFKVRHRSDDYLQQIQAVLDELAEYEKKGAAIIEKEEHFGWPSSNINLLHAAVRTANNHKSLWEHNKKIPKTIRLLHKLPVIEVNADRIEHSFNGWSAELEAMLAEFSLDLPGYEITTDLYRQVSKICKLAPIIRLWSNPKMRSWHWSEVATIIEREIEDPQTVLLGVLDGWNITKFSSEFQEVNDHVNAEYKLEESLETMAEQWNGFSFQIRALAQSGTYFVQSLHEAQEMVEEQLVKIDSMVSIESATRHGEETKAWKERLRYVLEVLELWWTTQKGYLRVRPFFFSKDVGMHLTKEVVLFDRLDRQWRKTMQAVADRPSLTALAQNKEVLATFAGMDNDLMQLRHGLGVFLSKARGSFARLFFLSEEDVLDVLSCGYNNPLDVNHYIHKLFPGYRELKSRGESCFTCGVGELGEEVEFIPVVLPTSKGAEVWLNEVEQISARAVHKMIDRARKSYDMLSRIEWVREQPQQAVLVSLHIVWTAAIEQVLLEDGRREGIRQLLSHKRSEVADIRCNLDDSVSRIERQKVVALAHHDLKQRDVLTSLEAQDPRSVHDFAWQSQLRYYWEQDSGAVDGKVVLEVLRNKFSYGLEYLGNRTPLVWNDSLERCYKIMGIALGWQLGGAMAGDHHSDTSEEYVADLAQSFGTVCFFFSCRLQPKAEVIRLLCQGMAGSSCWLCMEAIDNLSTELMSVLSLCILAVQQAVRSNSKSLVLDGDKIQMGIANNALQGALPCPFVTFKSKHGERKVPDSLRVLLRPVLILAHDIEHIMETTLVANGFEHSSALARRAKFTFSLLKQHLPQRSHYDFGVQSLMTAIYATVRLKEQDRRGDEMVQLLQAILEKMPSITGEDDIAFREAISDTFYGISQVELASSRTERLPIVLSGDPLELVRAHCVQEGKKAGVQPWADKVCQLLEVVDVSKGVIVVGNAMVGKTTCINSLVSFISAQASKNSIAPQHVEATFIHPTAMTVAALYGCYDQKNTEWQDGLLSTIFRSITDRIADPDCHIPHWFTVFDGVMAPDWCDSLMPLLGTHDFLQLPNCQSLPSPTANTFIFEASDLASASPSAVSRCGIVHLDRDENDWRWVAELKLDDIEDIIHSKSLSVGDGTTVQSIDAIRAMLDIVVEPCFHFLRAECKEALAMVSDTHRIITLLRLFQTLCEESIDNESSSFHDGAGGTDSRPSGMSPEIQAPGFGRLVSNEKGPTVKPGSEWVLPHFLFALTWSSGAVLDDDSRAKFDTHLRTLCSSAMTSVKATRKNGKATKAEVRLSTLLPRIGSVYDYAYMDSTKARTGWVHWGELQDAMGSNTTARSIDEVIVPTVDLSRYTHLLGWLIAGDQPMLLSGPVASGKTFYIKSRLSRGLSSLKYTNVTVNLSASSTPKYLQKVIQSKLEQGKQAKLAPRGDRHLIIHVEDMNLPEVDKFGSQPALELLRQVLDKGTWYSHAEPPVLCQISNCCFAATMQHSADRPPGVPVRMLRHLHMLHITSMAEEDIRTIFSTILKWYHTSSGFPEPILQLRSQIVEGALAVYNEVCQRLKPTPSCPHYRFSMRDLRAIFQGMLLQTAEDLGESLDSADSEHLRLFVHEILRVFYDRIRDSHDKEWFLEMMKDVTKKHLQRDFDVLFAHLDLDCSGDVDAEELRRLFFGKLCQRGAKVDDDDDEWERLGSSAGESGYDEIEDASKLVVDMKDLCGQYDQGSRRPMGLYMSLYSAEHIMRIMRVLQMKRGHAVLVGATATGRRSMTRMAAYMSKRKLLEPERLVQQPMTFDSWRGFWKTLIKDVAVGKLVEAVVLLRGRQVEDEKMEDLNCLLNGSEIPGLFTHREQVAMIQEVHAKSKGADDLMRDKKLRSQHVDQLFSDLIQTTYNHIHIVLCLDIEAGDFTDRMVKFPGLGSRCYMDWFEDWPLDTMAEMASNTLDEVLEEGWSERQRKQLMEAYGQMYLTAQEAVTACLPQWRRRHNHLSMSSFDAYLKTFKLMLHRGREEAKEQLAQLRPALELLDSVVQRNRDEAELFEEMKQEHAQLGQQEQVISAKIQLRDKELEHLKQQLEELEKIILTEEDDLEKMKEELAKETSKLKVVWSKHTHVLVSFSPRDVGKLKSVLNSGHPPEAVAVLARAVVTILEGTLIIMPEVKKGLKMDPEDDPMPGVRKIVGALDFKKRLLNLDRESEVTIRGATLVKQYHMKSQELTEKNLQKGCPGSEKLYLWVQGVLKYVDKLAETVLPMQGRIDSKERAVQPHLALRDKVQGDIQAVMDKYSDEETRYNELKDLQASFIQRLKDFRAQTARAAKLQDLLIGETVDFRKQWQQKVDMIQARQLTLDVDVSLAAAVLTYSGGLRHTARQMILTRWIKTLNDKGLRYKSEFDIVDFLHGTDLLGLELKRWELNGLPTDDYSIMNACIMTNCQRFPYIVDPHQIAFSWLRDTERKKELMPLSINEDYLGKLRFAVEEGIAILLDDMEEWIPAVLRSVLSRKICTRKKKNFVAVGDHMVPYNEDFRLYMTTRHENPDLDPDDAMWVTLVDFNMTREGLEQSLDVVLLSTKAKDLSNYIMDSLREHVKNATELETLDLMHGFAAFEGNILANQNVVDGVEKSQQQWLETRDSVMKYLRRYKRAKERSKLLRVVTAPLAALFEALWELTALHASYQNTFFRFAQLIMLDLDVELQQYSDHPFLIRNTAIFDRLTTGFKAEGQREEDGEDDNDENEDEVRVTTALRQQMGGDLESLSRELTHVVFFDLVRSIYEKHHLIFSFLAAVKTMIVRGVVFPNEWQHFLTNGAMRIPFGVEIQGTRSIEIHEEDNVVWEGAGRHGVRAEGKRTHPGFTWLSQEQWDGACRLSSLSTLTKAIGEEGSVADSILRHPNQWKEFIAVRDPTVSPLPCALTTRLSPFQRLLLIRVLHPQHVSRGMALVTQEQYGAEVTRIPPIMISAAHEDSLPHTPLLFLLGPGSDPTADIEAFAKESDFQDRMVVIEGSAIHLDSLQEQLADALEDGVWLLIRNVHTNPNLLEGLHTLYAGIADGDPHVDFRLWITSIPTGLSKDVYRQSMRVVWEAPSTVRGSLMRSYSTVPMADPHFGGKDPDTFRKCMFALCFTHAAVMERSLYGQLGWNQDVNVDDFDLKYCITQLRDVLDEFEMVTVKSLRLLVRDLMYAGRMMDTHDLVTVEALLLHYFPDQLVRYGLEYTEDGIYITPQAVEIESYISYFDSLPTTAPAQLFGLPEAADSQRLVAATDYCLTELQETQNLVHYEVSGELDAARLRRIGEIAVSLQRRVPPARDARELMKKDKSPAVEGALTDNRTRVLVQELQLRGRLSSAVHGSLEQLVACLEGRLVMMADMVEVARALEQGRVPEAWLRHSPPTELPLGQYVHRLMDSDRFLVEWAKSGTPTTFWLPAFFFPEALVSATCINLARHFNVGIETVGIQFEVPDQPPSSIAVPVTSGSYLTGLHLASAVWNSKLGALETSRRGDRQPLTTALPFVQVRPVTSESVGSRTSPSDTPKRVATPGSPHPNSTSSSAGRSAAEAARPVAPASLQAVLREQQMAGRERRGSGVASPQSQPLRDSEPKAQLYECPMYRTWRRTATSGQALAEAANGFVMAVPLPCMSEEVKGKAHLTFIKNGTALFIEDQAYE